MRPVKNKWTVLKVPENANHNEFEQDLVDLINDVRKCDDDEDIENAFNDTYDNLTHGYLENMYKIKSIQTLIEENSDDEHAYLNAVEVGLEHDVSRLMDIRETVDAIYVEINTGEKPKHLTPWETTLSEWTNFIADQDEFDDGEMINAMADNILNLRDEATKEYLDKLKQIDTLEEDLYTPLEDLLKVEEVEDVELYSEIRDSVDIVKATMLSENEDEDVYHQVESNSQRKL